MKIAYSGIEGSFASIAAEKIFPEGTLVPCKSFKEAYEIVENGECDAAVLPIENSFAGEVGQVTDLMYEGSLYVNGVYPLRVSQNLLGVKGSTLSEIKKVVSHPQAIEQCLEYLDAHDIETEQSTNTARAALAVAQKGDRSIGAIASKKTAELYGLEVIEQDINRDNMNTTRFAVLSKSIEPLHPFDEYSTCIVMFTVKNEAGALAKSLEIIGRHGYNMRVIRSRRLKNEQWKYYFYTELEGKISSLEGTAMVLEMTKFCDVLKVLGSYSVDEATIEE